MKIAAINNTYNTNKRQVPTFNGLWGKTSISSDIDPALCIPKVEQTSYYYPFKDETNEDIDKVIKPLEKAYIEHGKNPSYKVFDCRICRKLPFTQTQYREYESITQSDEISNPDLIKMIHYNVKDKFLSNECGKEQKTALNDVVSSKLNISF